MQRGNLELTSLSLVLSTMCEKKIFSEQIYTAFLSVFNCIVFNSTSIEFLFDTLMCVAAVVM